MPPKGVVCVCVCCGSGAQPSKAGQQVVRAGGWKGPVTPALAETRHIQAMHGTNTGSSSRTDAVFTINAKTSQQLVVARCCIPTLLPVPCVQPLHA